MIKRILVALDPDQDTPVATRYGIDIARRYGSVLTGLAVVDMGSIAASSKGGGVGSMYYAEKIRDNLTTEARQAAQKLTTEFRESVTQAGIEHAEIVEDGVPFRRIVEDVKYHDLLIMGHDPHFFYSHPKHHTDTLTHIIEKTIGPTLVVSDSYKEVKKVLVAYDGENESAGAIQRFVHLQPFGTKLEVKILNVYDEESADCKLRLKLSKSYFDVHGFKSDVIGIMDDSAPEQIIEQADLFDAELIVMGSHVMKSFLGTKLGEATKYLLEHTHTSIFMDH